MNHSKFAEAFAKHLSEDDFHNAEQLLAANCVYIRGSKRLYGVVDISKYLEANSALAEQKLDWTQGGEPKVKTLDNKQAEVLFTDFIKHHGIRHTYQYKNILTFDKQGKITKIENQTIPSQEADLKAFYQKIGLL